MDAIFRPLVTVVRINPESTTVTVALDQDGLFAEGHADVVDADLNLAAAQATCAAVRELVPDGVDVRIAWVDLVAATAERRGLINACVRLLDGDAEPEELLGSAFVRTDAQVAVVRAVLDAMPRRVGQYMGL